MTMLTVNFREGFIYAKFRENLSSRNAEITLSFTNIGKPWQSREFLTSQICFNAIRESKILVEMSGFTVSWHTLY